MFNPVDTRQYSALVDQRQEQLAADAKQARKVGSEPVSSNAGPVRATIGVLLMRAGAKIAGVGFDFRPHLHPGL
jgi:hypothetical protein